MDGELKCEFCKNIYDLSELRNRSRIFRDREEAGSVLAGMLLDYGDSDALVLAIPAGGVPVAASLARELELDWDMAVVSKITLPWNTEVGYGAVAFEGTVKLNNELVSQIGLTLEEIEEDVEEAKRKVQRRFKKFRGDKPFPNLKKRPVILVDDGVASGYTMLVAVEALKNKGATNIIIAVPTAHLKALERVAEKVNRVYCANIRGGWGFAVADSYQTWYDVEEEVVMNILKP
ncbi:MAG: phosphoribosyltransferase [Methanobacterium sp.]|jgi:predicted phosphoribosyltransferase|nr:phosphoribosyltransferase [Methanobacterium sp.]